MKTAKILFIDVETAPNLGWVWAKWQQNVLDNLKDWYLLSFSYKWATEKKATTFALPDFDLYKKDPENDLELAKKIWQLVDEADIIVAHNGNSFDLPKVSTRFLAHKMNPPSPYKTVDTLKIAKRVFAFDSNKLDEIGRLLDIGRKLPHTGFHLWKGCMQGDTKSWKRMKEYNEHDVYLLEKFYYRVLSWDNTHPQVNQADPDACPKCGSKDVQRRGFSYTRFSQKQRYRCSDCYGWFEGSAYRMDGENAVADRVANAQDAGQRGLKEFKKKEKK